MQRSGQLECIGACLNFAQTQRREGAIESRPELQQDQKMPSVSIKACDLKLNANGWLIVALIATIM